MPDEKNRPRPHGDPLESRLHGNSEQNRAQGQSDGIPEGVPPDTDRDSREPSDRARSRGSSADGIPEFDEEAGDLRTRQSRDGGEIVSEMD